MEGCSKSVIARGWCRTHYSQWYRCGTPYGKGRKRNICVVEGCNEYAHAHGYCSGHYWRLQRYGDVTGKPEYLARDNPREHSSWQAMRHRCTCPNAHEYRNYGGRGIKVCDRWMKRPEGFKNFLEDMGPRPEGYSLDRIDTNGDYCPENCRWADYRTQNRNRRSNANIAYKGETHTLKEWSEILGINYKILVQRRYYGWSVKRMFEQPVRKPPKSKK